MSMNVSKYIRALIISLLVVLLYGCSGSGGSEVVLEAVSERGYYISRNFGLKIDYIYGAEENIFIYENGNKISVAFLQTKEEITDLASCNDYFSSRNTGFDECVQIDGKLYWLAEKMEIFSIDEDLSLEENIKRLLIDQGKNPEDCNISIVDKVHGKDEYNESDALKISLNHWWDKQNQIGMEADSTISREEDPIGHALFLVRAYKEILPEQDNDLLPMLSKVEKSLEKGNDAQFIDMWMGNAFWGPLRQRRCGVFEGQFLTNWKPGHLIYFPQRPNILITMHGPAGGAGPDLEDVELAD